MNSPVICPIPVNKWIGLLDLSASCNDTKPIVFIGAYEHHSSELPWRELSSVDLKIVPLSDNGTLDVSWLRTQLESIEPGRRIISSLSAASNVTSIRTDVEEINRLVKDHGGVTGWDFAAAGPYVKMDMTLGGGLDALFFYPHKFVGGPGTPGVLIVNEASLSPTKPTVQGGGTVNFVSPTNVSWSQCLISREEAGTPDIIGAIRAGLAIELKEEMGVDLIESREHILISRALDRLSRNPRIRILGPTDQSRLAIVSFQIVDGDEELDFGLVVALLNDLFGIQARGGCSCAGPYGHLLLNIDSDESQKIDAAVQNGEIVSRPGWVRLNFNYFMDETEADYILDAIEEIAKIGWDMRNQYAVDPQTGVWKYQESHS